jgi:hypothetical protein
MRKLTLLTLVLVGLTLSAPSFAQEVQRQPTSPTPLLPEPADSNSKIYYKNKLEIAFDAGLLPYNMPCLFNFVQGDKWWGPPLHYTLVPLSLSLRWHLYDPCGPSFLRGNIDITFSGSYTVIPRGPESLYAAFISGVRYNFVQSNCRIAPYIEGRAGLGYTDSKSRDGVLYAQGQDFTFTIILGGGIRYNFNPRYSASVGITYMHISNAFLSKAYNYGINVYGPTIGFNVGF